NFALVLAAASAAIAIAVADNWRAKEFLVLAAVQNLIYWIVGQGYGGIFAGGATDPNAGLLFIVLAYTLYTLVPFAPSRDRIAIPSSSARNAMPSSVSEEIAVPG
ncbi:MAG: hypothetical protein ACLP50_19325, partial [Solirubrobacteraceae bacterium]